MSEIDDQLKRTFGGRATRPDWAEIERRAAGIRRRRQGVRLVAAAGVLALALSVGLLARNDTGPQNDLDDVADADDAVPPSSVTPAAQPTEECPEPLPEAGRPVTEIDDEIAELLAEIEATGLVRIPWLPDCTVEAFVSYDGITVLEGVPHPDLEVWNADGEHIGWLVYGLPALTIEDYEADPEGHRQRGLERAAQFE